MYRANVEYQKIQIYNVTKLVFSKATKLINVRRFLKFYLFGIINYNNVYLHIYMRVIFGFYLLIKLMNKTPWQSEVSWCQFTRLVFSLTGVCVIIRYCDILSNNDVATKKLIVMRIKTI